MTGRRIVIAVGGAVLVVGVAAVTIAAGRDGSSHSNNRIVVSDTACAPRWVAPRSGRTVFSVQNTSKTAVYDVDLDGGDHVSVYGEVERLGPMTSDTMDVVLGPGSYTFECESLGGGTLNSAVALVKGPPVAGVHPFAPVDSDQMHLATLAYRASLRPWLQRLQADTDSLDRSIRAGQLASARRLWLTAHLDYARLGAAYDTFGPYNELIDGRPLGLPGGVHDPGFHGFLRLEYGLWHEQPHAELVRVAAALDLSVHGLVRAFPRLPMANGDVALRTHEILENTLQFELTGETDEGSHTNLETAWANVQGTKLALNAIAPLLTVNSPGLVATSRRGLDRLAAVLAADRGRSLQSLSRTQRERLDGETSELLEQLAPIPDKLEIVERLGSNGQDPEG
jgi:high-affinity iron transporter